MHHRRMKTYAVAWVDSSTKLRTRVYRAGGGNPTWHDKFLFSKTSAFSIEINAIGIFRDRLIGSVRVLINNFLPTSTAAMMRFFFAAFLIRSPSEDSFGILNIGGMVLDAYDGFRALSKVSAIDYHDLTGLNLDGKHHSRTKKSNAKVRDIIKYIPSHDSGDKSKADDSLTSLSSPLEGRSEDHGVVTPEKETLFDEEKEEIINVNME
ncbi:hypothetical protein REPUB_Repub02eG0265900 [Reevesia pubescens]